MRVRQEPLELVADVGGMEIEHPDTVVPWREPDLGPDSPQSCDGTVVVFGALARFEWCWVARRESTAVAEAEDRVARCHGSESAPPEAGFDPEPFQDQVPRFRGLRVFAVCTAGPALCVSRRCRRFPSTRRLRYR